MRNQKGMTLVEILVAMGLMVMVVFCFTPFMLSSLQNVQVAGDQREEVYQEKGDMEEQLAEGIDYTDPSLSFSDVGITFEQGTNTATVAAKGLFLTSVGDMLVSFLASDKATFDIAPGSVSENCPNSLTIDITCDFMKFGTEDDDPKFELKENGVKVGWVQFEIVTENHAVMSANSVYEFDIKNKYEICYGAMSAPLIVTPSSLIAVGENGAYYVITSEKKWKLGEGTEEDEDGKLGSNTLRDAVWTGTQYVAGGDKGSWYYTEEEGGWQQNNLDEKDNFTHLHTFDGEIYTSGYFLYRVIFQDRPYPYLQHVKTAKEIQKGSANFEDWLDFRDTIATAATTTWIGNNPHTLWATFKENSDVSIDTFPDGDSALVHIGTQINDLVSNERTGAQAEVVAALDNGKIYTTSTANEWTNNGDFIDPNRQKREDKDPAKVYRYHLEDGTDYVVPYVEGVPMLEIYSRRIPLLGTTYYIKTPEGNKELSGPNNACELSYEEYFQQDTLTTNGQLNAAAFGETESGGIWVVGGDVALRQTISYTRDVDTEAIYSINSRNQWVENPGTFNPAVPDGEVTVEGETAKILWRDADEHDVGTWQAADVPPGCTTINDIEFIGGKFYAVGDDGWILTSTDGKYWTEMQKASGLTADLYGIAGWGEE